MKKIVVILIVGVYIGSIFLTNFFGLEYVAHEMTAYVEKVECNTIMDLSGNEISYYKIEKDQESGKDVKCFKNAFIEGIYTADEDSLARNLNTYSIDYTILPANANNKTVLLSYSPDPEKYIVDQEQMTVTFLKRTSIRITITSADVGSVPEMIFIGLY